VHKKLGIITILTLVMDLTVILLTDLHCIEREVLIAVVFVLCSIRDFIQFFNPVHGNCYAYNSGWNSSVKLKTSTKSGRRHGKEIYIFC